MRYEDEARAIWREFVPPSGQAQTVQGELMRAVEKLRDEAIRNGNGNWDKGFKRLLRYLEHHLLDKAVFPESSRRETQGALRRIGFAMAPVMDDEIYDRLGDCVVEYYRHYGSKPHQHDPDLLR